MRCSAISPMTFQRLISSFVPLSKALTGVPPLLICPPQNISPSTGAFAASRVICLYCSLPGLSSLFQGWYTPNTASS